MVKKLLFRADGNSKTGLGHLYRLFALVEMFKEKYEFVFITKESSTLEVIPQEYPLLKIPQKLHTVDEPKWLKNKFNDENYLVIADGYQFDTNYQKNIKEAGFKLMYIDDLTSEHMYADIVVNHSPKIKKEEFSYETYTKFILGSKYAILRPSFLAETRNKREISSIQSTFICFGGADTTNLTLKSTKALINLNFKGNIYVVLGAAYTDKEIYNLQETETNIYIFKNLNEFELVKIMKQSSLSIVSSSTILYELCCVKSVIISGYYVDNQKLIYNGFLENNAIVGAGNILNFTVSQFEKIIKETINTANFESLLNAQSNMFDDKIKVRYLKMLEKIC